MARVDVAIPCYNYGRFLPECVASVLSQEGPKVRVLIIDNASLDDSLAVARALAANDERIEVRSHDVNRGATCSYNAGIDWARSEYILILDADDLLAPGALARAVRILDANPEVSFVHGVEDSLHSDGVHVPVQIRPGPATVTRPGVEVIRQLCRTPVNTIGANTVVRRTQAQRQAGHYNPCLPYTDDLEMWLRLAMLGSVVTIRAPQAIRRLHKARMSTGYQSLRDFRERERAFESFFRSAGAALPDADILMAAVRRGLGQHAYWSGLSHLLRGQLSDARDLLGLAHRELPTGGVVPPVAWLLRTDRPFARALAVLSERAGRPHASASRRRRGQGVGAGLS